MSKKLNVESFNLDHTKVAAPYVRLAGKTTGANGDTIYKYDLRFKQPNKAHMDMPALHSLEHMLAEFSRNHHEGIIDVGPMGCQTGFYMAVLNDESYENILQVLEKTLQDILEADEVPACNELQCGWAASHSLEGAQSLAKEMLNMKKEWPVIFA
ncbi:S-ribosylhomocysteine lyase [Salisediminibacterium selenitireducens]|uniref:S-ribosylhomocysteine lyase n=1 Tax=Bacillus selenitireducens (strain ATCC 700615 / DSM 15326 / MLS10) TaxID=439292 RepID=D6XTF8_BACIE|nr:S-ribosylhomocysteine lyase [Salisediminibacterium selenitireducens]ADH99094.1 quorum-sensing autoinducer 2 (AI-2), LuxS [[Bacillus] selenitireducens MLS10]